MHTRRVYCTLWISTVVLFLTALLPNSAHSQSVQLFPGSGYFTLTDGIQHWYESPTWDEANWTNNEYPIAYDTLHLYRGSWSELHAKSLTPTLITQRGEHYLKLLINEIDPTVASVTAKSTADGLDTLCMWQRTNYTGYYYQEHGGYFYYLIATRNNVGVKVIKSGDPRTGVPYWFNWDFGAALTETYVADGQSKESYYWLKYDSGAEQWSMSGDSYQRPDTRLYFDNSFEAGVLQGDKVLTSPSWVYSDPNLTNRQQLEGNSALYLPVDRIAYPRTPEEEIPADRGLTSVQTTILDGEGSAVDALGHKGSATVKAIIEGADGSYEVKVMPAYTEYREETFRYGINTDYHNRSTEGFNAGGFGTYDTYYEYLDSDDKVVFNTTKPTSVGVKLKFQSLTYQLDNRSHRYVTLAISGEGAEQTATLQCRDVPPKGVSVKLFVTVQYEGDFVQQQEVIIPLDPSYNDAKSMPEPENAPVVAGRVFGGGRMANVGGGTAVTVHRTDSISAVYGGNDIAGWVQGENGTQVQIGSTNTDASHPVHIGSVYGGGCGLYVYSGLPSGNYTAITSADDYYFSGKVYQWGTKFDALKDENVVPGSLTDFAYTPAASREEETGEGSGTVPNARKTSVIIGLDGGTNNDYVRVDSVFGGAENAFVGLGTSSGDNITVDVYGGTVYALFGGNNYGGNIESTSQVLVNVHDTKLAPATKQNIQNSFFREYGRDYGIRYLFGGGNLANSPHAKVMVEGGMIDSCYLGGNLATVSHAEGEVNCVDGHYIFENDSITREWESGVLSANKSLAVEANYTALAKHKPGRFAREIGRYNIRTLFGGNKSAAMYSLSTITLTSGGISNVYGGGNAGDMRNSTAHDASLLDGCFAESWEYEKPTVLGTLVMTEANSRIMVEQIYGGCRMANVDYSSMLWLRGGTFGYVYGGNDISGDVGSEHGGGSYAVLDGNVLVMQSAYGGSNGYYHCHADDGTYLDDGVAADTLHDNVTRAYQDLYGEYVGELTPTQNNSSLYIKGGTVLNSAYGGGVMTDIGFKQGGARQIKRRDVGVIETIDATKVPDQQGSIRFTLAGGMVGSTEYSPKMYTNGNIYGGGFLSSLYGLSYFHVTGSPQVLGSLYAGNDCRGNIESFGSYAKPGVAAKDFKASNGDPLNELQGDGSYNHKYTAYVLIDGTPQIRCVYGSGNGAYNYHSPERPEYSDVEPVCLPDPIDLPEQPSTYIDLNIEPGGYIDTVFGGGNGVGVRDNLVVLLNTQDKYNSNASTNFIGTIFGGNNRDDMEGCVPDIKLEQGCVANVYGGGNAGSMKGSKDRTDICGNPVREISTYVLVNSASVAITGNLFGGCRMADVKNMAYVDIRNTDEKGVKYVYGGNDISGTVNGNARVDVSGGTVHNIYGGSNGHYQYPVIDEVTKVYSFDGSELIAQSSTGEPYVDSTSVNLFGGNLTQDVFAGGRLGNSRSTYLYVNDRECPVTSDLVIKGNLFGGGEGDWENLHSTHRGNVQPSDQVSNKYSATHVHLHHATELTSAQAYGGGKGGDVQHTYITTYPTWEIPFKAIYGGCWGSSVFGTTHLTLNGKNEGDARTADMVFGGNDFTGNVYKSEVNIQSGHFGAIYGAGNGYGNTAGLYTETDRKITNADGNPDYLTVPNNEYVVVNVNGPCEVDSNLYGGGKLGTSFVYRRDAEGVMIDASNNRVEQSTWLAAADTTLSLAQRHDDPEKYSHIVVNVHDGFFNQNIYAGAAGLDKHLVYGVKVLNMDGGEVVRSVYGGSERVDDGYRYECQAVATADHNLLKENPADATAIEHINATTTRRPSSIVNVAGGRIRGSVYGGGYMGMIYGSSYVNVGIMAIDSSEVWRSYYLSSAEQPPYLIFKPGYNGDVQSTLTASDLEIGASIYGGANWGTNTGSRDFNVTGVKGGETLIRLDGENYLTNDDPNSTQPSMFVTHSIIGSGTSALGGDVRCRVDVRNYGGESSICHVTPSLRSIQRADTLMLYNSAIRYTGAIDAISSYLSQQYTINRIDVVECRGYNVIEVDALMTNIGKMEFFEDKLKTQVPTPSTPQMTLTAPANMLAKSITCNENTTICERLAVVDPDEGKYTAVVVNNGVNIDVIKDGVYGPVEGYAYFMAETGTNAIVAAKAKSKDDDAAGKYGGFVGACQAENLQHAFDGADEWSIDWTVSNSSIEEYQYNNYYGNYRIWSVGEGLRSRYATIWAHANPSRLDTVDRPIQVVAPDGNTYNFALALSHLDLPSSTPGNYYTLSSSGIVIRDDNSAMRLSDEAWNPVDTSKMKSTYDIYHPNHSSGWTSTETSGKWEKGGDASALLTGAADIHDRPGATFGLVLASGDNFELCDKENYKFRRPDAVCGTAWDNNGATLITGNPNVNIQKDFVSAAVGGSIANSIPQMDLYLTYDTNFSNTLIGNVSFQLEERNSAGAIVGTIDVIITISTIVEDFKDQEYEVLAMYNEGRSNHFRRKAVLPATMDPGRMLYLKQIQWMPTDEDGKHYSDEALFNLTDKESLITDPTADPNRFALSILPTDNITSTLTTYRGWADGGTKVEDPIDFYSLIKADLGVLYNPDMEVDGPSDTTGVKTLTDNGGKGVFVGELDGRGEAAFTIDLTFDGEKLYSDREGKGYIGKSILTFDYYSATNPNKVAGEFKITVYVKTREHGDTIYLASAETIERPLYDADGNPIMCGSDVMKVKLYGTSKLTADKDKKYWSVTQSDNSSEMVNEVDLWANPSETGVGKEPSKYVRTFRDAFDENIYQEGDVIAIIGQVDIEPGDQTLIQGIAYDQVSIIRYTGHHHQLPTEGGVYRGTMISLTGGTRTTTTDGEGVEHISDKSRSSFTARAIAFDGSAYGKLKQLQASPIIGECGNTVYGYNILKKLNIESDYGLDTNVAYGPVLAVAGTEGQMFTTINLEDQVTISNNWNGTLSSGDDALRGAVNVGTLGTLNMINGVEIRDNFSSVARVVDASTGEVHPYDGTVFVKDGNVTLGESFESTAILIDQNYIKTTDEQFWGIKTDNESKPLRYYFVRPKTDMTQLANVFLTRSPSKTESDQLYNMLDQQTDVITLNSAVAPGTHIGVTKWFPGIEERDTVRIVYHASAGSSILPDSYKAGNFFSDNFDYDTLYHQFISRNHIYLHRCATFRQQEEGLYDVLVYDNVARTYNTISAAGHDVLQYIPNAAASCPNGSDQIVYSLQGGFFPYTYTWTETNTGSVTKHNTGVTNGLIAADLREGKLDSYNATVTDTFLTESVTMALLETEREADYTVVGTDLAGCTATKYIHLKMQKRKAEEVTNDQLVIRTTTPVVDDEDAWKKIDDDRLVPTYTANVERNYRAVQITPMVWADRNYGSIEARVGTIVYEPDGVTRDAIFVEDELSNRHDLADILFCEGDHIKLSTTPNYPLASTEATAKFIMWDFDPFYSNPADYIVPSHSDTVIAYYAADTYWKDVVNTAEKGGVSYAEGYTYEGKPNSDDGYVVTYHGDVHIYNEQGLAWFISAVNGLNNVTAHTYYFHKVYLHRKAGNAPYDMSEHLWTPVGTVQHPFRGWFIGVDNDETAETAAAQPVVIRNVIVNEPNAYYAGFFGNIDTARIRSIRLESAMVRGGQYVGALAANSTRARIDNCGVDGDLQDNSEGRHSTSILSTRHTSGGLIGASDNDIVRNSFVQTKFIGSAVYTGGIIGDGNSTRLMDNVAWNANRERMSAAVYEGGLAGRLVGGSDSTEADEIVLYTIDARVNNANYGSVVGGGVFPSDTTIGLRAIPSGDNYSFEKWSNGETSDTITIAVSSDLVITAIFSFNGEEQTYSVVLSSNDGEKGTVSIDNGKEGAQVSMNDFTYGQTAILYAHPHDKTYHFQSWSDGNTDNPHYVVVTENVNLTATFYRDENPTYTLAYQASPQYGGSITGPSGELAADATYTLTATPNTGYHFAGWKDLEDGGQVAREVTLTQDTLLTAYFEKDEEQDSYSVVLSVNNEEWGYLSVAIQPDGAQGSLNGEYPAGTELVVTATPTAGGSIAFLRWSDDNTDNPRTLKVSQSITLQAIFGDNAKYAITASVDAGNLPAAPGSVSISQDGNLFPSGTEFAAGDVLTLTAVADDGYQFTHWNDQNSDNPRTITVTGAAEYTAHFTQKQQVVISTKVQKGADDNNSSDIASITVNYNGQSYTNPTSLTVYEGDELILSVSNSTDAAYKFGYWNINNNSTQQDGLTYTVLATESGGQEIVAYFIPATNGKPAKGGAKKYPRSYVANNYVRYSAQGQAERVGGLVGYASNTTIENNYVYGNLEGVATEGAIGAVLDEGAIATHNYYASSATTSAVGQLRSGASLGTTATFEGEGNQVQLDSKAYGVNNLTRALNTWVRQSKSYHRTWRSDLVGVNSGYPIFGNPDLIPVVDTLMLSGCDSIEWDGEIYYHDAVGETHIIDPVAMVDSTLQIRILVHHSSLEQYADSIAYGDSYDGYGFYITPVEYEMLQQTVREQGSATLTLSQTLVGSNGCDSIISLALTVRDNQGIDPVPAELQQSELRVYPNPTTSVVNVELSGLRHVELYDNEGRRLQDYIAREEGRLTIQVDAYPVGVYYLRVYTSDNVIIQKLIKQ